MRPLTSLVRLVALVVLFAALVCAGAASVQESRLRAPSAGGAPTISHGAEARGRLPAGIVLGRESAMPGGGVPLTLAPACEATSVRPDAAALEAGVRRLDVPSWHSADGGVSAPLGDGRVVWLYGDTQRVVERSGHAGLGLISNSMLISSGSCFSQALAADRGAVIPDPVGVDAPLSAWPTAVTSVDHGGWSELLVFTGTVKRGRGFWGFTLLGASMTRFVVPDGGAPRRMETTALTADSDTPNQVTWGTATAAQGGWLYVYGTRVTGSSLGREVYVARTTLADVSNVRAWQFRGRNGWGASTQMVPVVDAATGTSHIISVVERGGEWYVVSKVGGDLGDDVGVWRAASPASPFTLVRRQRRTYSTGGARVRYMPLAHPEYSTGQQLVVSMSRNVSKGPDVARDGSLGRPEFFTVSLP